MDPGWRIVAGLIALLLLAPTCLGGAAQGPERSSFATRGPAPSAGAICALPYRSGQDAGLHRQPSLAAQCAEPERPGSAYRLRRAPPRPAGPLELDALGVLRREGPDRPLRPLLPLASPLAARAPPSS